MPRSDSPLRDRMVFNVGARRSGTFWLQRIITAHPRVSNVPSETYLFSLGLAQMDERFHEGARGSQQVSGLFMEREAMLDAFRDLADAALLPHLEPGTERLAERTPWHAYHLDLIGEVYPDSRVVHIIRDGRDVSRSLVMQPWGPTSIAEAAVEWRETIETARRQAAGVSHYLELRYEDLHQAPDKLIPELFGFLGLDAGEDVLDRAFAEAGLQRNTDPNRSRVGLGKWQRTFTRADFRDFEREAGELREQLGYERGEMPARPGLRRPRLPGRRERSGPPKAGTVAATRQGTAERVVAQQEVVDALLEGLHTNPEAIAGLLSEKATARVVGPDDRQGVGPAAAELLASVAREDEAFRARQLRGDVHPTDNFFVVVLDYATTPPSRRTVIVRLERGRVESVVIYRS